MSYAYEVPNGRITLKAAADHSAKRYYAVVVDSNGKAAIAGADKVIAGVIRTPEASGIGEEIVTQGITFAIFGAQVAAGANVSTDANGKFITAVAGPVVGIAVVGAAADGDIGSVLLR